MSLSGDYTPERIAYNKRMSIKNGIYAAVALGIFSSFLPLYAIEALHATDYQVALLSSLPQLVNLLVLIPGALFLSRLKQKKGFTTLNVGLAKVFFLIAAFVPWIYPDDPAQALVIVIAFYGIPLALAGLSWQAFISDLIPAEERNAFFGQRNRDTTLWAMVAVFLTGMLLNLFDKKLIWPYQFFFVIAFLFGVLETWTLFRHDEPVRPVDEREPKRLNFQAVRTMFQRPAFVRFFIAGMFFNFAWQMAWPLFNIYQIKTVHATAFWLSLFTVANQISQSIAFPYWGRLADRFGTGTALAITALGMATAPTLTVLSTSLVYLVFVNLFTGAFVAGTVLLLFNQLLHVSPAEDRTSYIAVYNLGVGAVGFIAPQVGVYLASLLTLPGAMHASSLLRFGSACVFAWYVWRYDRHERGERVARGESS
ncbi:MAG: Permeases of the major facilitator superfamily [Candidatus Carbobacillus altaicus]|uniref:Permeases of the major facilitator superfamily n=1 Tax=Candidatus Carbonibacillus altaicus TaxID=2163959 RepID=A0A2R6Y4T1_9BACL|nr:MAG: Permeases of the major facilitator superfamily [Candidatus Carbobacillus altaicus]